MAAAMPSMVRAQTVDGDYARISAPDVAQAADFLRDMMGCERLDEAVDDQRALLECAQGSVIEVVQGSASAAHAPAIRLHAEQVDTALAWLRQRQVRVIGAHPASSLGYVHVDVITPWGQTLELVGPGTLPANDPRSQLAAD